MSTKRRALVQPFTRPSTENCDEILDLRLDIKKKICHQLDDTTLINHVDESLSDSSQYSANNKIIGHMLTDPNVLKKTKDIDDRVKCRCCSKSFSNFHQMFSHFHSTFHSMESSSPLTLNNFKHLVDDPNIPNDINTFSKVVLDLSCNKNFISEKLEENTTERPYNENKALNLETFNKIYNINHVVDKNVSVSKKLSSESENTSRINNGFKSSISNPYRDSSTLSTGMKPKGRKKYVQELDKHNRIKNSTANYKLEQPLNSFQLQQNLFQKYLLHLENNQCQNQKFLQGSVDPRHLYTFNYSSRYLHHVNPYIAYLNPYDHLFPPAVDTQPPSLKVTPVIPTSTISSKTSNMKGKSNVWLMTGHGNTCFACGRSFTSKGSFRYHLSRCHVLSGINSQ